MDKKKVLSVKLILNGDDQLNISESKVEKKRKVLEDNNSHSVTDVLLND